mmetsp:Transcript_22170/g.21395  ORF Transcript_22170/g.21395 Transcript_22170/m.21395 type:complete len:108 (-) Transcript_22170:38-361(-)
MLGRKYREGLHWLLLVPWRLAPGLTQSSRELFFEDPLVFFLELSYLLDQFVGQLLSLFHPLTFLYFIASINLVIVFYLILELLDLLSQLLELSSCFIIGCQLGKGLV